MVTGFARRDRWGNNGQFPLVRVTESCKQSARGLTAFTLFVWSAGLNEEPKTFKHYDAAEHPGYLFMDAIADRSNWAQARAVNGSRRRW